MKTCSSLKVDASVAAQIDETRRSNNTLIHSLDTGDGEGLDKAMEQQTKAAAPPSSVVCIVGLLQVYIVNPTRMTAHTYDDSLGKDHVICNLHFGEPDPVGGRGTVGTVKDLEYPPSVHSLGAVARCLHFLVKGEPRPVGRGGVLTEGIGLYRGEHGRGRDRVRLLRVDRVGRGRG